MKFISTFQHAGLRHVRLGTLPPLSECIGEAEHEGRIGAVLRLNAGGFVFQEGNEYQSLDYRETILAFSAASAEYHAQLMARLENTEFCL